MATKKVRSPKRRTSTKVKTEEVKTSMSLMEEKPQMAEFGETDALDPAEEKILDWILKIVVGFVLGWLGLSILLVIGGFFHLWG